MSSLLHRLGRLFAILRTADCTPPDPERMNLRDWADLPAHHPVGDRAPC